MKRYFKLHCSELAASGSVDDKQIIILDFCLYDSIFL